MRIVQRHGTPFLLLLAGIAIGFFLSAHWVPNVSAVGRQDYESLEAFSNILSIVKKNYVEDVETKNLVGGAINGMLNSLDPHSAYLTPDHRERRNPHGRVAHRRHPGRQGRHQTRRPNF